MVSTASSSILDFNGILELCVGAGVEAATLLMIFSFKVSCIAESVDATEIPFKGDI